MLHWTTAHLSALVIGLFPVSPYHHTLPWWQRWRRSPSTRQRNSLPKWRYHEPWRAGSPGKILRKCGRKISALSMCMKNQKENKPSGIWRWKNWYAKWCVEWVTKFLANIMWTEHLTVLVIGKAKKPRCFKIICGPPVEGLNDVGNSSRLGKKLGHFSAKNRKVVFMLNNCSAHDSATRINNITVDFFPTKHVGPSTSGPWHNPLCKNEIPCRCVETYAPVP